MGNSRSRSLKVMDNIELVAHTRTHTGAHTDQNQYMYEINMIRNTTQVSCL